VQPTWPFILWEPKLIPSPLKTQKELDPCSGNSMKTTTVEVKGNLVTKIFMFNLKKKAKEANMPWGFS
jgi:hypothetical protein